MHLSLVKIKVQRIIIAFIQCSYVTVVIVKLTSINYKIIQLNEIKFYCWPCKLSVCVCAVVD